MSYPTFRDSSVIAFLLFSVIVLIAANIIPFNTKPKESTSPPPPPPAQPISFNHDPMAGRCLVEVVTDPLWAEVEKPTTVTYERYEMLEAGMPHEQVAYLLGSEGIETAKTTLCGMTTTAFSWVNADGSNVLVMFQNDALASKSQWGLK